MRSEPSPPAVYLHHDGQQLGPYPLETARAMVAAGRVPHDVLAWGEGMDVWVPLSELLPLVAAAPPVAPVANEPEEEEEAEEASFFGSLPWAFVYPFQKDGLILLGTGTVFFWFLALLSRFGSFYSWLVALFAVGYLAAYLQSIVQSSAQGEGEMPPWPEFGNLHEDILLPCFRFWAPCFVCLGPGLVFLAWGARSEGWGDAPVPGWAAWGLLIAGALYLPMALLGVAMADAVAAMSPRLVIPSIFRVPREYAAACGVLAISVGLSLALGYFQQSLPRIPVLSTVAEGFLSHFWRLYWLTVEMRVLGLLYFHTSRRLAWF